MFIWNKMFHTWRSASKRLVPGQNEEGSGLVIWHDRFVPNCVTNVFVPLVENVILEKLKRQHQNFLVSILVPCSQAKLIISQLKHRADYITAVILKGKCHSATQMWYHQCVMCIPGVHLWWYFVIFLFIFTLPHLALVLLLHSVMYYMSQKCMSEPATSSCN